MRQTSIESIGSIYLELSDLQIMFESMRRIGIEKGTKTLQVAKSRLGCQVFLGMNELVPNSGKLEFQKIKAFLGMNVFIPNSGTL